MKTRTVVAARQIFSLVPSDELEDLVTLLQYYSKAAAAERAKAMEVGFAQPADEKLEESVRGMLKAAGANDVYVSSTSSVCRFCGK